MQNLGASMSPPGMNNNRNTYRCKLKEMYNDLHSSIIKKQLKTENNLKPITYNINKLWYSCPVDY